MNEKFCEKVRTNKSDYQKCFLWPDKIICINTGLTTRPDQF